MSTQAQVFDTAGTLSIILSVFLPILVGLATRESTHPGIKAVLLLALSIITSVVHSAYDAVQNNIHWSWQPVVYSAVISFIVGVTSHFGLWSPTGVSGVAAKIINIDPPKVAPREPQHARSALSESLRVRDMPGYGVEPGFPPAPRPPAPAFGSVSGAPIPPLPPLPPTHTYRPPAAAPYGQREAPNAQPIKMGPSTMPAGAGTQVIDTPGMPADYAPPSASLAPQVTPPTPEPELPKDEPPRVKRAYVRKAPLPVKTVAKKAAPVKKVPAKKAAPRKATPRY